MALLHYGFESQYLNGSTDVHILLPDKPYGRVTPTEFYGSGRRYKVLWLLHGSFANGSEWLRKSRIELYAAERQLIVVLPNGMNSEFSNIASGLTDYAMFDFLTKELMPLVYGWLPASDRREDNFIAGYSMGGSGVMKYVADQPELYGGAAVLSSAPQDLREIANSGESKVFKRQLQLMERGGGLQAFLDSYENVWDRLKALAPSGRLPKLYFTIGKNDFLLDMYMAFKRYAAQIGLEATFEEVEGYGHEWRFWDRAIERALDFFGL